MATTIQIDEELISLHQIKVIQKDKYQKIRDLANKFDNNLYEEYRQEKLKDLNREEQKYPISKTG